MNILQLFYYDSININFVVSDINCVNLLFVGLNSCWSEAKSTVNRKWVRENRRDYAQETLYRRPLE